MKIFFMELLIPFIDGFCIKGCNEETRRRITLLICLTGIGIAFLLIFGTAAILEKNIPVFACDILSAGLLFYNLVDARKRKQYQFNKYFGICVVALLYVFLYITDGIDNTAFVWYFTFPLIASYLLGSIRGGIATTLMSIPILTTLLTKLRHPMAADYSISFETRFIAAYLLVGIFSYLFEKTREINREELNSLNQRLEITIRDRTSELIRTDAHLIREIEERKCALEALHLSRESLEMVLDSIDATIYVADMESHEILFMNKYMKASFGGDMTGERCWRAFRNEPAPCRNCANDQLIDSRKMPTGVCTRQDRNPVNGKWYACHDRAIRWIDGRLVRIQIAIDMTEFKDMEEKLSQSQKLESLGMLAGGVAHDLNNMLSGIVSYPELLLLDLPDNSRLRKPLETIQKSGIKATAIVQDLLAMARRGVTNSEIVDLRQILKDYLSSPEYGKMMSYNPHVDLRTEIEDDLLNIEGSPVHLFKALMNMISNAAESMPNGGTITIILKNEYVTRTVPGFDQIDEGAYTVLSIKDTGLGMSAADIEHVFEPFYTKKVMGRSGTGLGMSVVWGVVKDHNGRIDINSTMGKGTRINIRFPATRASSREIAADTGMADIKGKGETILLVDDVAEQREIASGILNRLGYQVSAVSSGEQAVTFLKSHAVDLLVLDMIMTPGIDGLETYRQCREIRPDQKAIIASGYSESEKVRRAQSLGAGAYLRKPYTIRQMGETVLNELRSERN